MISAAIEASRLVRQARPDVPIIYGGWHPTLLPEQTLQANCVDIVVRGQGELTLLQLVERLIIGGPLENIAGLSIKSADGRIVHAPERTVTNINNLPLPAYDLVDFEAYARACGNRKTVYASSVGCPYACNYCTDTIFYERRFNALRPERVVQEVTDLVKRHHLEEVSFLDSNFLVDVKRALAIARGFRDARVPFNWTFQASTDLLCRMSDAEVRLLQEGGVSHIGFGTESASEKVLKLMNKPHQKIGDMYETARKCHSAGIKVTFNLIVGFPGETDADRTETLSTMDKISTRFPNVHFSPNLFTPYPGIAIWNRLNELGLKEPKTLEEWAQVPLGETSLPWLQGREYRRVKRMLSYFLLNHQARKAARISTRSLLKSRVLRAATFPISWRLRHEFYRFPVELWMMQLGNQLTLRRSLVTGQSLGPDLEKIC
jgi:radical SAM superfamily enzyme YgiQ (UPF0313 family)